MSVAEIIGTLEVGNGVGEGPHWDERVGALWWVDITGRAVLRLALDTLAVTRWPTPGFPAFVILRKAGGAVVGLGGAVCRFDTETGALEPWLRLEPDRPANRINEAKVDPAGRLWVGTMQNNLNDDASGRAMTASTGALYRLEPDGSFARVLDGIGLSNTLAWADAGRTLYFGDSLANRIRRYQLDGGGEIVQTDDFQTLTPAGVCDGSAIDADGFLWNARFAGGKLVRFAPDGSVDCEVALPVSNPTSCCFGGADLRTLFVTSARFTLGPEQLRDNPREGSLVVLRTAVAGTPSTRFTG